MRNVGIQELREAMDLQKVRGLQLTQIAMVTGVLFFVAFVLFRAATGGTSSPSSAGSVAFVRNLSLANLAVGLAVFGLEDPHSSAP
jgi:hypothetical protein